MKRAGIVFFCCHVALSGLGEVRKPRHQCFRIKTGVHASIFTKYKGFYLQSRVSVRQFRM